MAGRERSREEGADAFGTGYRIMCPECSEPLTIIVYKGGHPTASRNVQRWDVEVVAPCHDLTKRQVFTQLALQISL
jgi:hypothetical protein